MTRYAQESRHLYLSGGGMAPFRSSPGAFPDALALPRSAGRFPCMCGRRQRKQVDEPKPTESPGRLKEALRKARVEQADRTGVVVDLHDAEIARLELLSDALDPLFEQIPAENDLFDRGVSRSGTPRLSIEPVAHGDIRRDKRVCRLLQDTRYGRKVLGETGNVIEIVNAVTKG